MLTVSGEIKKNKFSIKYYAGAYSNQRNGFDLIMYLNEYMVTPLFFKNVNHTYLNLPCTNL